MALFSARFPVLRNAETESDHSDTIKTFRIIESFPRELEGRVSLWRALSQPVMLLMHFSTARPVFLSHSCVLFKPVVISLEGFEKHFGFLPSVLSKLKDGVEYDRSTTPWRKIGCNTPQRHRFPSVRSRDGGETTAFATAPSIIPTHTVGKRVVAPHAQEFA